MIMREPVTHAPDAAPRNPRAALLRPVRQVLDRLADDSSFLMMASWRISISLTEPDEIEQRLSRLYFDEQIEIAPRGSSVAEQLDDGTDVSAFRAARHL